MKETKATRASIDYVFSIAKYLYFNVEIDEEVKVSKLAKEANLDRFTAALAFIMNHNITLLGGFRISYTDETRTAIKKLPHLFIDKPKGYTDEKHVIPIEYFRKNKENDAPMVRILPYKDVLE